MRLPKEEQPLRVEVTPDGELVIRIGIGTLAFAAEHMEINNPFDEDTENFKRLWRVIEPMEFANDVRRALCDEGEDGSTPLTELLDAASWAAIEDGSLGCVETDDPQEDELDEDEEGE